MLLAWLAGSPGLSFNLMVYWEVRRLKARYPAQSDTDWWINAPSGMVLRSKNEMVKRNTLRRQDSRGLKRGKNSSIAQA